MDTSHLVWSAASGRIYTAAPADPEQSALRRPGALRSQARRGARDVSRTDGPDRAEQSDEFIGLLAHEVAQTRRASRFRTFSTLHSSEVF